MTAYCSLCKNTIHVICWYLLAKRKLANNQSKLLCLELNSCLELVECWTESWCKTVGFTKWLFLIWFSLLQWKDWLLHWKEWPWGVQENTNNKVLPYPAEWIVIYKYCAMTTFLSSTDSFSLKILWFHVFWHAFDSSVSTLLDFIMASFWYLELPNYHFITSETISEFAIKMISFINTNNLPSNIRIKPSNAHLALAMEITFSWWHCHPTKPYIN